MAAKEGNWFKRHKILTVILVIIGLGAMAGASGGNNSSTNNSQPSSEQKSDNKTTQTAKVGEPARDGKFEFIVKSIECGRPQVGNEFLNKKAQGQFCLVNLNVKNIGDVSQSLSSFNQYAYDAQNRKFTADDTATLYAAAPDAGSAWYNEINPGNSVDGTFVFDVPKGVSLTTVELHDSTFSSGIKVNLQ